MSLAGELLVWRSREDGQREECGRATRAELTLGRKVHPIRERRFDILAGDVIA